MSLQPGTSLGPYVIEAQLGVGGMGEVYRALDTRLERTVAIEALPEDLASKAGPQLSNSRTAVRPPSISMNVFL